MLPRHLTHDLRASLPSFLGHLSPFTPSTLCGAFPLGVLSPQGSALVLSTYKTWPEMTDYLITGELLWPISLSYLISGKAETIWCS